MASTDNKLLDLNGLQYFWNEAKKKFVTPALMNGGLNFEYLATQYYWCPNRPEYDTYQGKPTEPQGVAYLGNNKLAMVVCPYRNHTGDDNTNNVTAGAPLLADKSEIKIFGGVNQPQYITIDGTFQTAGLGHSNSMTFSPDLNLIFIPVHSYVTVVSGTGVNAKYKRWHSKDIKVVDPTNNYGVKCTITVNTDTVVTEIRNTYSKDVTISNVPFVAYDKIEHKLYGWVGDFYLIEIPIPKDSNGNVISGTSTAHLIRRITRPQTVGGGQQGFAVMGDLVFLVKHFPNQVWVFSLVQDRVVRCYSVPQYDCFGHQINYLEGIDYDPANGDFYIASFTVTSYWQRRTSQYRRACYVHRFNPFKDSPGAFHAFGYYDSQQQAYVYDGYYSADSNAVKNLSVIQPSRTSPHQRGDDHYPFGTINEAITALQSGKFPQAYFIYFLNSGTYDEYVTISDVNCVFNGEDITVHGMDIQNSRLKFTNAVTVDGANVKNAPPMYIHNSKVGFNGLTISGNIDVKSDSDPSWNLRALIYASDSEVDCSPGTYVFNGGDNTKFDVSLVRSKFIAPSKSSITTNSSNKAIRISSSEWCGATPTDKDNYWSVALLGEVRGGFASGKLTGGTNPFGFVKAFVQTTDGSDIRGFESGTVYKEPDKAINVFSVTPYGIIKTSITANGSVSSTTFVGTPNPSSVTCSTTFLKFG